MEEISQGSPIHHRGRLRAFLNSVNNPQFCGNLLDIGSQDLHRPWFVRCESILALVYRFHLTEMSSDVSDHSQAMVNTEKKKFNFEASKDPKRRVKAEARAPDMLPYDCVAINEWKLVASACFLTYPHQDAGGYATWIEVEDGLKIWVILRPKAGADTAGLLSSTEHIIHMEKMDEMVDIFVLMLPPRCVL